MNEANICYLSACGDSVNVTYPSVNASINNENSGPGFDTNSTDRRGIILPKITDSANHLPLYLIKELDRYFSPKKMAEELRLLSVFCIVK